MRTASRRIPIVLDAATYRRLEQVAIEPDRDPWQQARHWVREALERHAGASDGSRLTPETREAAHAPT
jgi:hypothetical protein